MDVQAPPRLMPEMDLPPYSYVPRKFPHPISDPAGHSHSAAPHKVQKPPDNDWRRCAAFRAGIDLFNHGFYWEAHESWEQVWLALGRKGDEANVAKALIKIAAACVKAREGRPKGIRSHARRAIQLLETLEQPRTASFDLSIPDLIHLAGRIADNAESLVDESDRPVVIVSPSPLQLMPEA